MRYFLSLLFLTLLSSANEAPNILLICIDDLRPELGCYGQDYIHSPAIDQLSAEGTIYTQHYVQAPTCGASRYALLTGCYGAGSNNDLFQRAKDPDSPVISMPQWFRQQGYTTVSVGKVSHHPGGWGGKNWDSKEEKEMPAGWVRTVMPAGPWQHPRGAMHGLANGEVRRKEEPMSVYQAFDGPDTSYPDGLITEAALEEMAALSEEDGPFLLAVGLIRPHLPFGAPAQYLEHYQDAILPAIPRQEKPTGRTTWHPSGEFMRYDNWGKDPNEDAAFATEVRKHYAACVSYADAQVGRLLAQLDSLGQKENTIVVLWGDHGWHLGEHQVWGKHTLFEESLHAPLIIRAPEQLKAGGKQTQIAETVDIFPTLCALSELPTPQGLKGHSLTNHPRELEHAVSYKSSITTLRTPRYRLIIHDDAYVELYDHHSEEKETKNIATEDANTVKELAQKLHETASKKLPQELLQKVLSQYGDE